MQFIALHEGDAMSLSEILYNERYGKRRNRLPIKRMHETIMGSFSPGYDHDDQYDGYIRYHDHDGYATLSDDELDDIRNDTTFRPIIRNAAAVELASRALNEWNRENRSA
jgi:hypothetical protein